jgi:hypothetical protein
MSLENKKRKAEENLKAEPAAKRRKTEDEFQVEDIKGEDNGSDSEADGSDLDDDVAPDDEQLLAEEAKLEEDSARVKAEMMAFYQHRSDIEVAKKIIKVANRRRRQFDELEILSKKKDDVFTSIEQLTDDDCCYVWANFFQKRTKKGNSALAVWIEVKTKFFKSAKCKNPFNFGQRRFKKAIQPFLRVRAETRAEAANQAALAAATKCVFDGGNCKALCFGHPSKCCFEHERCELCPCCSKNWVLSRSDVCTSCKTVRAKRLEEEKKAKIIHDPLAFALAGMQAMAEKAPKKSALLVDVGLPLKRPSSPQPVYRVPTSPQPRFQPRSNVFARKFR